MSTSASSGSALWTADVHSARQLVQVFRECHNALGTIEANLAALSNITHQKRVLEAAMRRRAHCFDSARSSSSGGSGAEGGDGHGARAKTSAVAVAPLGVLVAFTPATSEALLGQHQDDQQALLSALHQAEQKWAHRVQRATQLLGTLETRLVSAPATATSGDRVGSAATRKAAAAAYMDSFYGTSSASGGKQAGAAASSSASSRRPLPPSTSSSAAACAFYQQHVGLPSLAALFEACRGLVAILLRMHTALHELTLALRNDLLRTLSGTRSAAVAMSAWLEENHFESAAVAATATTNTAAAAAAAQAVPAHTNARPSVKQLLTWEDALAEAEKAISPSWQRWKDVYLTEESYLLLAV